MVKFLMISGEVAAVTSLISYLVRLFPVAVPWLSLVCGLFVGGGAIACSFISDGDFRKGWASLSVAMFLGVSGSWF